MENEKSPLHDALHPYEAAEEEFAKEFPADAAAEGAGTENGTGAESDGSEAPAAAETPAAPAASGKTSLPEKVRRVMIGLFLLVMLVSGWKLGSMMVDYYKNDKGYNDLADEMVSTPAPTAAPTAAPDGSEPEPREVKERPPIIVNMDGLLERNPDTVGWLYCEDTPIDFAVVQSTNNNTYLGWNFERQPSVFGWIFEDYRCKGDFSGLCHTIYGHNMQNGSVFAVLEKYQKQDFYEKHPVMWLITPDGSYKVRLFAGTFLYGTEEAYGGFGDNEEGFRAFLRQAAADSSFNSGIDPETLDRVVMLSTCSNVRPDMRFVVIGTLDPVDG